MIITSDNSVKLKSLYKHINNNIEIEKKEVAQEGGRGIIIELLTDENFLTALAAIAGYTSDSFKAWLEYKKDDKREKEKISDEILKDPTTIANQKNVIDMIEDKENIGLYIEFEKK